VLTADPYAHITSTLGIDRKNGRPIENLEKKPVLGKVVRDICPAAPGAKDWQPSAYSPLTGFLYLPHQNLCMDLEAVEANYIAGPATSWQRCCCRRRLQPQPCPTSFASAAIPTTSRSPTRKGRGSRTGWPSSLPAIWACRSSTAGRRSAVVSCAIHWVPGSATS
jgi:hypothetical protein